MQKGA